MSALEMSTTVTLMPPALTPLEVSTAPATLDTLAMALMAHAWTLMSVMKKLTDVMSTQTAPTQLETTLVNATLATLVMDFSAIVR